MRMTSERRRAFVTLLRAVDQTLMVAPRISYAIADSTALGFARHNKSFIPWDDDIDVFVGSGKDVEAIRARVASNNARARPLLADGHAHFGAGDYGWLATHRCRWSCTLKIFDRRRPHIPGYNWSYPFVDVFDPSRLPRRSTARTVMLPPRRSVFAGVPVSVPRDLAEHLKREFGPKHMSECKANSYDHAAEKRRPNVGKEAVLPCSEVFAACGHLYDMGQR
jgi:hypothetical protein